MALQKKTETVSSYPRLESLIESENFDEVNQHFTAAYGELEKIPRQKAGLNKAKQAKKIMKAYQLVMDLLKDLLKLKYELQEKAKKENSKK